MKITNAGAIMVFLLTLTACQTLGGIGATDCFTAGGTIDSSGDKSVCKMQDGSMKPIK